MGKQATGNFDLTKTEEPPFDDQPGATLSRVVITKEFHGDIEGTSVTQMMQAMSDRPGSAGYVAIERVIASVHGRRGTFVLQHNALSDRGDRYLNIVIVPDSGTGELSGLRGQLEVDISGGKHAYTLDYSFAPVEASTTS